MSTSAVDVSVLVPTRDRLEQLQVVLTALAAQRLDGLRPELVVADNGSAPDARAALDGALERFPWPARTVDVEQASIAASRNAAAAAATAPVLVFLNDDIEPADRDWLRGHHAEHAGDGWRCVVGPVVWAPAIRTTPVMRWLDANGHYNSYRSSAAGAPDAGEVYASNLSVTRAAFEAAGGFDERLGGYGWEEYDLALRLFDGGIDARYREDLVTYHHHTLDVADSLRRMESVGRATVVFNAMHAGRSGLLSPHPAPWKVRLGAAMAPVTSRLPFERVPERLLAPTYWAAHQAALARGYAAASRQRAALR